MYKNPALYQMYMESAKEEYLTEALVKKESYYLKKNLIEKNVSSILAKSENRDKIIDFTGKFIDNNSSKLLTAGPMYMFTFSGKDIKFLYDLFDLTEKTLLEMFSETVKVAYIGESDFNIINAAPHKLLIAAIIMEALDKNYTDIIECGEYISIFAEYPMIFRTYWKIGKEVKIDVMEYTIEHLSNQFGIKKQKNLLGLLKYIGNSALNAHIDRLKTGLDYEIIDYINRIRNQLNSAFRNIANKYYDNYKKDATLHSQNEIMDDGKIVDSEGTMTNIAIAAENIYSKFLTNSVNTSIAGAVASSANINKENLIAYVNKIYANKNNRLAKFIENVVYLFKSNTEYASSDLDSSEFINFGLALYRSLGTSKIKQHLEIKAILDYWMNEIINIDQDYKAGSSTIIYYRKSVFNYFIFMIKYYN